MFPFIRFDSLPVRKWYILMGLLTAAWLVPHSAQASHVAAAEFTYECVDSTQNQFLIRLTAYSDCDALPVTLDSVAQLFWYESASCGVSRTFDSLYFVQRQEITNLCPTATGATTCDGGVFLGVNEYVYEAVITLPQACSDWVFGWALAARNPATTNTNVSPTTNIYIESTLNNLDFPCNNSVDFFDVPMYYICAGQPAQLNLGGQDPDGDSLAYELITPQDYTFISGQPSNLGYISPSSPSYPITTNPPFSLAFNNTTGQLTFTPASAQRSILAVRVTEYRDGQVVGTTIRDITVVVLPCNNQGPVLNPPFNVQPNNALSGNTFAVCVGQTLSFEITGFDPDGGDIFVETNLGTVIPAATTTVDTIGSNFFISFSWPTTIADVGVYYFNVRAYDDDCPYIGEASIGYRIVVNQGQLFPPQDIAICPSNTTPFAIGPDPTLVANSGPYDSIRWIPSLQLSDSTVVDPLFDPAQGDSADYLVILYPSGAGNCAITQPVRIRPDDFIALQDDTVDICFGDTVELDARLNSGGTATWEWSPGTALSDSADTDPLAFPDTTTLYTVTATTALNCTYQATALVNVIQIPTLDPISDQLLCNGDTLTVAVQGQNLDGLNPNWTPVSYLSDTNSFTVQVWPNDTVTYTVSVGNICGSDAESFDVQAVPQLSLNFNVQDVLCAGETSGEIQVIPLGGAQSGLTYDWSPQVSTSDLATGLAAGTYQIEVTDAAACFDSVTLVVDEPTPLLAQVDSVQDAACFGENNGSISLSATGGTAPYQFALNGPPFVLNQTFNNLFAGTYDVLVRDANGCIDNTLQAVVQQPNQPVDLQVTSVTNANCNSPVGAIQVTGSGGTPAYSWLLNGSPDTPPFTSLLPGNYLIELTDVNGCDTSQNVVIVQVSDPRMDLLVEDDPTCFGDSTGSASITVADGQGPYLIQGITGGLPTTSLPQPDTITYDNLPSGYYEVLLTDSNGCAFSLNFELEDPDSLYGDVLLIQVPLCSYTADGVALIQGVGGTQPYQYGLNSSPLGSDSVFTGLAASTPYTLILEDSLGCRIEQTVSIQGPPPLNVQPTIDPVNCPGGADGEISLSVSGGRPVYEYSIDNVPFGNPSPFGDDSVFINLLAGTYQVGVQDDNGCLDSVEVTVTEPSPLSVSPIAITDVDCFGAASGAIDVTGSGGTAPYQFATNLGGFSPPITTPPFTIGGLREGSYIVIMRDANGCTVDSVVNVAQPARLTGSIVGQPVQCHGDSNGVANVTPQGGIPPYQYFWSNGAITQQVFNLPPGANSVRLTDANGCEFGLSTEISEPPDMQFDTTNKVDASCFGLEDGELLVSASGGTDTLTYLWSNGSTDTAQVVGAGIYDITVTDANNCVIQDTLEINQPPEIIIEVLATRDASCGAPTGEIEVDAVGGFGDFTYRWNTEPPQAGRQATGLFGGPGNVYTVQVVDSAGCENSLDVTVGVIGEPIADFGHSFEPLDSVLFPEEGVQFINRSENGRNYLWTFGDGGLSNEEHPAHRFPEPGTYTIQLIVIDEGFACPDTTERTLVLLPPGAIYVPNVFTPNNDAHNQGWRPRGVGVVWVESRIYTRWGRLITTLNSMDEQWYGEMPDGSEAQEGVYTFVVRAVLNDGQTFQQAGTVTLVR